MSKRAPQFARRSRDAYDTPASAVAPLLQHLGPGRWSYTEPCAGSGKLAMHLGIGRCDFMCDIEPRAQCVAQKDAMEMTDYGRSDYIITNPPWDRKILHPMIVHFATHRPTWLLFDADWMHTKQAAPFLKLCRKIVSVGRVKWIEDSPHTGKDNAAWYLFDGQFDSRVLGATQFFGRVDLGGQSE